MLPWNGKQCMISLDQVKLVLTYHKEMCAKLCLLPNSAARKYIISEGLIHTLSHIYLC